MELLLRQDTIETTQYYHRHLDDKTHDYAVVEAVVQGKTVYYGFGT